jgi:predicted MFS family arabinose efflux permease
MGLVSPDERGAASGISAALWRLPNSISTAIGAGLMQSGALAEPFYIATILYVTSITIFWFAFSSMKLPEEMTMKGV